MKFSGSLRALLLCFGSSFLGVFSASATQLYWDGNSTTAGAGATPTGTWGTSNFWNTDSTGANLGAFQIGTLNTDDLFFVAAPGAASGNNATAITISGAQVANSLTFQHSGAFTLSGGTSITLGDGTAGSGGITMNQYAYGSTNQGAVTINTTPIFLNNSQTWTNNSASLFTKSNVSLVNNNGHEFTIAGTGNFTFGTINNDTATLTGSGNLVKSGSGVFALSGVNAGFTGNTTVNGGTLLVSKIGSIGSGNLTLNGGIYEEYWTNDFIRSLGSGAGTVQLTGGASGFSENGSTSMNVKLGNGTATVVWGALGEGSATGFFNPSTLVLQSAAAQTNSTLNFQNGINLNGATRTIASYKTSNLASGATISGVISNSTGTAGLIKEGAGLLILSNTNTYNGSTTISAGILQANSTAAIGNSSATNTLIFNGGTLRAGAAFNSAATRGVTMTATGIIDTNNQLVSIAGDIGGAGGLTKNGTNTLTLSGTNSYGGVTTVNAGTLAITKEASLASNTAANLNVKSGATLQLNVDSAGSAGFTASNLSTLLGNILVANSAAEGMQAGATLSIDTSTATGATFTQGNAITNSTGAFGGLINLTKLGAGTLVLDEANTYTGLTTISGGTLQLNDGGSISNTLLNNGVLLVNKTGAVTVGTDYPAMIGGTGSIAFGASTTQTISTPTQFQFSALNTTGGGSIILSGVTTPVFGGLSGATGNLATVISSGYSGVTNLTLNTPSGTSFTYGGVIADGAAGMDLTKTGAGTQILTGNNTYTGTTFLNGGTLQIGGTPIGKLSGTTDLNFNGGTLQFNRSTNADIDAINNAATITVNSSSTFGVTSADAGGGSANETVGAVTLNAGQMNFNWTNGGSSGTIMTLTSLSRSGTASANFNSGFSSLNSRWKVTGAGTTTGGQIIGPWYTTGANAAGFASTDYAVYSSDFVAQAAIAGSAETAWTTTANAYTNSLAAQTLTATRTITALRNTGATATLTLASGFNLETYGLLNGVATLLTVAPGTGGVLTTPTGGGNLYLTPGAGAITVSAPINNNGGNVTLVKNGSGTLTLTSTTSNFSGGVVLNAGTLAFDSALNIGGTNNTGGSTVPITVNGTSTMTTVSNTAIANLGTGAISISNGSILTLTGTSRGTFTIGGAITGDGGVTLGIGSFWGKAALNSTSNTFKGALTVTTGNDDGNSLFSINSIADGAGYGNIILNVSSSEGDIIGLDYGTGGANGAGGGGATSALVLDHRQIIVQGTSTNTFNNSSNQAVTINTDIGFSGTGARSMRFGVNARAGSGVNTFAGKLTDNVGGAFSPTFNGGTWVLTNSNTHTGATSLSAGTLALTNSNAIQNSALTVSGGILSLRHNTNNTTFADASTTISASSTINVDNNGSGTGNTLKLGAVNVSAATTATLTVTNGNSYALGLGAVTQSPTTATTLTIANAAPLTMTSFTTNSNATPKLSFTGTGTATITGNLTQSGSAALALERATAAGTLILQGTSNMTGAVTITNGTIQTAVATNAFGSTSGISIGASGILALRGDTSAAFSNGTTNYPVTLSASGATINVDQASSATVGTTLTLGTVAMGGAYTLNTTGANGVSLGLGAITGSTANNKVINNTIASPGGLTIASYAETHNSARTITFQGTGDTTVTGAITQNGANALALTKSGNGILTLSGTSSYTGITTITSGVVEAATLDNGGNDSSIGKSSNAAASLVFGAPTATLRYTGSSNVTIDRSFTTSSTAGGGATIESSGAGTLSFNNTVALAYGTTAQTRTLTLGGTNIGNNTFGKVIANNTGATNATSLVKTGAGTWILSQTNTYTGTTSVNDGTLLVNGSTAAGSTVSVDSGATLGGTGTIGGAVNVTGVLSPGASIETLGTGTLSFANGSTLMHELDSSVATSVGSDLMKVTGNLNLAGTVGLSMADIASTDVAFAVNDIFSLINYTGTWNSGLFTFGGNALADEDVFSFGLNTWRISYDDAAGGLNFTGEYAGGSDSFVNLTVVSVIPEPRAALLGALGALMLLRRRRN